MWCIEFPWDTADIANKQQLKTVRAYSFLCSLAIVDHAKSYLEIKRDFLIMYAVIMYGNGVC